MASGGRLFASTGDRLESVGKDKLQSVPAKHLTAT
jgi:hypothetical protein